MSDVEETKRLATRASQIVQKNPGSSWENIYHTLLLLEEAPILRLRRALLRGGSSQIGHREVDFLTDLINHEIEFMIVGLSGAVLQGAPLVTKRIDLWSRHPLDQGFQKTYSKGRESHIQSPYEESPIGREESVGVFDFHTHVHGLGDFEEEKFITIGIEFCGTKVPVLKLDRIIQSKRSTGRLKDKLAIEVLEDTLRTIEDDRIEID